VTQPERAGRHASRARPARGWRRPLAVWWRWRRVIGRSLELDRERGRGSPAPAACDHRERTEARHSPSTRQMCCGAREVLPYCVRRTHRETAVFTAAFAPRVGLRTTTSEFVNIIGIEDYEETYPRGYTRPRTRGPRRMLTGASREPEPHLWRYEGVAYAVRGTRAPTMGVPGGSSDRPPSCGRRSGPGASAGEPVRPSANAAVAVATAPAAASGFAGSVARVFLCLEIAGQDPSVPTSPPATSHTNRRPP